MNRLLALLRRAPVDRAVVLRAVAVVGAYLGAALVMVVLVLMLRGTTTPGMLRDVLAFFFIAQQSAGLEPATARAQALRAEGAFAPPAGAYLAAGAAKALIAGPILAVVWRVSDPTTSLAALAWTPLMCASGFWATDLRVLLDLQGRHGWAIGLKQGLYSAGNVLAGVVVLAGGSLGLAVALAAILRAAVGALAALTLLERARAPGSTLRLLGDRRWLELAGASLLGAATGSSDRVAGLRLLSPGAYSAYYLTMEGLIRFWLLPYLISPILFARLASGQGGRSLMRWGMGLVGAAGLLMMLAIGAAFLVFGGLVRQFVGAWLPWPTLIMALGVVIASFAQLRVTQLQAQGRTGRVIWVMAAAGAVAVAACIVLSLRFGAGGLMVAMTLKAGVELTLAYLPWKSRPPAQSEMASSPLPRVRGP